MADQDNGGYRNYVDDGGSDFKRKADPNKDIRVSDDEDENSKAPGMGSEFFIKELLSERVQMDGKYPHADRLLQGEIASARQNGKMPLRDLRYIDIYNEKPIKVTVKVLVPIKEHPKFNFVGKILGPKGNSLRRLQEDTLCKMAVMGRGSMKDRIREENFRQSLDPKYGHLNDELHVEISALASPCEAHARVAYALAEVRKYLIPDSNDEIRQEQFRELVADGVLPPAADEDDYYRGRYQPPPPPPAPSQSSSAYSKRPPRGDSHNGSRRPVMPAKQKVLSILDRARTAMDDRYVNHHEDYDLPYERGYHPHHQDLEPPPPSHSRSRTRPAEPPIEYRRDYYRETSPAPPPPTAYVKPSSDHHHHHHSHRSTASSSSSWRSAGGAGAAAYPSASSRSHHASDGAADDHYAPPPPPPSRHRGGYPSERSYRGSPYMRPQK